MQSLTCEKKNPEFYDNFLKNFVIKDYTNLKYSLIYA